MAPRQTYGSITIRQEDDEVTSLVNKSHFSVTMTELAHRKKKRRCLTLAALVLVAVAIVAAALVFHRHTYSPPGTTTTTTSNFSRAVDSHADMETDMDMDNTPSLSESTPLDMGLRVIDREEDASPSDIWGDRSGPLPTNGWYLNLVSHKASQAPDEATRVYTIPYIIDMAPANDMAGMRIHWPVVSASDRNVQMVDDFKNGLTLGATTQEVPNEYQVDEAFDLSHLGVSLKWASRKKNHTSISSSSSIKSMTSHIIRGMPYATMQYFGGALPSLYSYNGPAVNTSILVDGSHTLKCSTMKDLNEGSQTTAATATTKPVSVKQEIQLHFINSDFTWGLFFSQPVQVRCDVSEGDEKTRGFQLSVVNYSNREENQEVLTVRLALIDQCTTGKSNIKGHCKNKDVESKDTKRYAQMIRESAPVFPTSPKIQFAYPKSESLSSSSSPTTTNITIDWGAQTSATTARDSDESDKSNLLMFAMPHHQDTLSSSGNVEITKQCVGTFHGSTCLVRGNKWTLSEDMGRPMSFTAPRPPAPDAIPALASALSADIHYKLSNNMFRAASDTYFSGKILARLGRVIVVASEMKKLAAGVDSPKAMEGVYYDIDDESLSLSIEVAASEEFPSEKEIAGAVEQLKKGVQVWINGKAEAPYVFDQSWGGLVNCGCRYVGKGDKGMCNNTFPDCPALIDVNEDFGNGYYNDHHYHYGYHIYAAAVVAKFDPEWGEQFFEQILLYIRDIANPSPNDEFFTQFRHKDWFLGSSWASGIVSAENSPHGRNEESSSEAIAAYEAVALYGAVMVEIFRETSDEEKLEVAKLTRDAGQLLTATELRATNRYWHVWSSDKHTNTYPATYKQPVVGMLYDTMASFQTWFAPYAVVSYGIQLMPFTPVVETRDDPEWASELYPLYKTACEEAGDFCFDNGWSILQAGLCAETGDQKEALEQVLAIPEKVFETLGGDGNSLTNTIWFIATRKPIDASTHS